MKYIHLDLGRAVAINHLFFNYRKNRSSPSLLGFRHFLTIGFIISSECVAVFPAKHTSQTRVSGHDVPAHILTNTHTYVSPRLREAGLSSPS